MSVLIPTAPPVPDRQTLPTMRPPHVVHVVLRLDVGGLERIVVDLVRVGRRSGQRVSVLCLEAPGTLAGVAEAEGATIVSLGKRPGRTPELAGRITAALNTLRPDVVHTHQIGALWYVAKADVATPVLHTEHIDNVAKAHGTYRRLRTRLLWWMAARRANLFCCVSDDIARSATWARTVPTEKVQVVCNGIDVDRYAAARRDVGAATRSHLGIPPGHTVVGTVGRLAEVKRHDLLLLALAAMRTPDPQTHLLIVGDGPERERLRALSFSLGMVDHVHFVGYQEAPERFLAAMDLFVLSSRLEGLPLSLLEAWATGLPVISTAVGGIPSVVTSGVNGLLVPEGDAASLGDAIGRVLSDPAFALSLAAAGGQTVRDAYSLERMATEYRTRYLRLVGPGAPFSVERPRA